MEMGGGGEGELGVSVNMLWGRVVQMDNRSKSILFSLGVIFPKTNVCMYACAYERVSISKLHKKSLFLTIR